jgi:chitinase
MRFPFTAAVFSLAGILLPACTTEIGGDPTDHTNQALVVQSNACRVEYKVSSSWGTGFGADVTVTNRGAPLQGWTLQWEYTNGQRVTSLWNGTVSQTGGSVTVRDAGWNAGLGTNSSVAVGFNGTLSGSNGDPRNFRLNGVSCEGSSGTGGSGGGTSSGGSTSSGGTTSTGGTTSSGGNTGCNFPAWQQGRNYAAGDVVEYQGQLYIAEHANPGYSPTISTWYWDPYSGGCGTGGSSSGGSSSGGGSSGGSTSTGGSGGSTSTVPFAQIVSRAQFEAIFPNRNPFYTYDGLVEAAGRYPAFAGTGTLETRRREAAAFLANVGHETGSLVYVEEINKGDYADYSPWFCPPAAGKRYFGRGPIQLSWNYNYCAASTAIFGDREVLRLDPDRVARESWLAWATALWFWTTQSGAGTMTAHTAMVQGHGFGETIRTINGGLECGGRNPGAVQSRINRYQDITSRLGVSMGSNTSC